MKRLLCLIFVFLFAVCAASCSAKIDAPDVSSDTVSEALTDSDSLNVCTFSVDCSTVFQNLDSVDEAIIALLPENGAIFPAEEVAFNEGESVSDLLRRLCDERGIALETTTAPVYGSVYVEGIASLYEFDAGSGSGWMYRVNGEFPNYGASAYKIAPGDRIEWVYTCDFGDDVGDIRGAEHTGN